MKPNYQAVFGLLTAVTIIAGCGGGASVGGSPNPIASSPAVGGSSSPAPGGSSSPAPGGSSNPAPGGSSSPAPGGSSSPAPGGSSNPAPGVSSSPAPGVSSSPAPGVSSSPAPGGSSTPVSGGSPAASPAIFHPGNNGDTFVMNGTLMVTYDRSNQYPSPEPTATTVFGVAQNVAVTNPATFNGSSNAIDFKIAETDTQMSNQQTFAKTLDEYFQYTNTQYTGNFLTLGYTQTDDNGYKVRQTNGANDQIGDMLPEAAGASWSNMAGRMIATDDGNGNSSSTTYADDGSYNGTTTYQNLMPSPNPTGSQLTNMATLTTRIDGSATYNTPRLGTNRKYNYVYSFSPPSASGPAGMITVTTTIPPAAGSTAAPTTASTMVPNWMPASVPGSLANETNVDNGPKPVPSACLAPSGYTQAPNQIVQNKMRVDPLNGELETTTTTTYDSANVGPVCVLIHDVQVNFYDFSGQNGVGYFRGVPQQTSTIDEVLYLSTETLQSAARHTLSSVRIARSVNVALAQARISALRIISRSRAQRATALGRFASRSSRGVLK